MAFPEITRQQADPYRNAQISNTCQKKIEYYLEPPRWEKLSRQTDGVQSTWIGNGELKSSPKYTPVAPLIRVTKGGRVGGITPGSRRLGSQPDAQESRFVLVLATQAQHCKDLQFALPQLLSPLHSF